MSAVCVRWRARHKSAPGRPDVAPGEIALCGARVNQTFRIATAIATQLRGTSRRQGAAVTCRKCFKSNLGDGTIYDMAAAWVRAAATSDGEALRRPRHVQLAIIQWL
jgi:hypothetical protein